MALPLLAIALLIAVTLGYAAVCAAQPFTDCRRCGGLGHALKTDRTGRTRRGKPCRRCKTTGKRIRTGRHLFNLWQALHHDGTR
jgi:hypothetical protein